MRIIMTTLTLFATLLLSGCSEDISGPPSTPEMTARGFFSAIYVTRDVRDAKPFVDKPIWDLLQHYRIASSVQRHMLNLPLTNVKIKITEVDLDFFRKFSDSTKVEVRLTGLRDGQKWKDDRTLRLEKRKNKWIITEIVPEKMR